MNIPTKLLQDDAKQLIEDMNSAWAATGVAASIHFASSNREGMPTLLSHNQIWYTMKRTDRQNCYKDPEEIKNEDTSMSGLYQHMENEGYQDVPS